MRSLILVAIAVSSAAAVEASPRTKVTAVALAGPWSDLDAACAAWTTEIEPETSHALACRIDPGDAAPVRGARAITLRGAIRRAEPFYAEGLDIHCGLAITTAAGIFLPPEPAMFGCGSERSRSDLEARHESLTFSKLDKTPVVVWAVSEKISFDPENVGATGPKQMSRTTAIVVCRGGEHPACAVVQRAGTATATQALDDVTIVWP